MVKEYSGKLNGKGRRIGIVVSRFNENITKRLLEGCLDELAKAGVKKKNLSVCWVPGAFEISLAAQELAKKKTIDAVICLGAVIRGETYHYELVAQGAAQGIAKVALDCSKPVIFEVLATDTVEQANKRSQENGDNKGRDAALAALEMADLLVNIKKQS
ncbi:MAG: 6,7-dimethyl-8-ribityllumazine synthase [Omnitrophica WOR_2 bacterium GWF2_38_59]|nr:MAG: 6,7-dimethyl-8-ribityllumazine synthase [Omnitrophica WOR_2 bacterium GWF2_38_59]OGX51112.1 MAG: 6,7-dimethyl-8-ribityllumazine synthase [Omnitrophica WOR_2 bacterium RIFOXYA2_FULL_38_17]OGX51454.1 MAG: 6,7-dimethyl-8-ribityllumazine synthase [Omnitrophica WOR_2 bacterium RIFOXYA12_FULL_38_10]OGX60436.1 MAG: 6,7-dimethyl-8-ribityllumazine synthase [Omnitrophica WOR_2 bacterium RIFOXYB2_FULL_38_16]HBG60888.1 6,7-dimethyl-8-ribityllumazine synthase [Candidatus Omnitrophota bacterium]